MAYYSAIIHVVCKFSAGAISSAIATPTDVLKVRMQVHGRGSDHVGLIGCFREIYHTEGVSGLWRVCYSELNLFLFLECSKIFYFNNLFSLPLHRVLVQPLKEVFQCKNILNNIQLSLMIGFLNLFSAAVIAAVELPVYDFCKLHLLETFGDHVANHFM